LNRPSPAPGCNPARLSALSALFPLPVVVAELESAGSDGALTLQRCESELLTPREWDSIRHCAERRIVDFCCGRMCARRALAEFGIAGFDLLSAEDRQPIWPPGLIGSITHTDGFAAAVVAERRIAAGLGLDVERIEAVRSELWQPICTPEELERLRALPNDERALTGALTFVAKEAFFKCQYPLAGERFGFDEVELERATWSPTGGDFHLRVQRASNLDRFLPPAAQRRLSGHCTRRGPYLIAAVALAPISQRATI
jgi:4'-phosphopantetheinyl transferase EntD